MLMFMSATLHLERFYFFPGFCVKTGLSLIKIMQPCHQKIEWRQNRSLSKLSIRNQSRLHLYRLLSQDFVVKLNTNRVGQLMTLIVLYIFLLKSCLITRESVRSCVCGIATLETLLQTAGHGLLF